MPKAFLRAVDLNEKALELSRINATKMAVADRALFVKQNVFHISEKNQADIVVSNPPYIAYGDPRAQQQTLRFEPEEALFSEQKGYRHLRGFFKTAEKLLKKNGAYFFELGAGQDLSFVTTHKMRKTDQFRDLAGFVRVMEFRKLYG